ncbi:MULTISPECIES: FAD-binding oxidoreductase [Bacillus]|uniref:FAD-binding oxidoreductase n=1 Tax=Bacillus TaxID=1386 RepID=UPI0005B70839|nr:MULTISPECIES: FAD-binding oxidoreductase [Bacillus]KIQ86331.1 FAD-dependent oxidase [Bacillus sp. L_1B0_8]KIQ87997.1 FAD-dependent oxidase [Bacillus sp. L_1B0_5]KMP95799.1 FAD-dependent oxidase [Bacillus cereus]MCA0999352.1 FAD-binding oxidoreductase [Bacillus thuringiensis]MCU7675894.1 FAD-binding oxidoreductase [Bacillus thuringiensis]
MNNQKIELTGRIVTPNDPDYNSAREEFNTFFNKFPLIIVFAQNTQDVVNAVRWSRLHNVPIRMRSGRHNYEALSVSNAGLVIDVSEMKQLEIDHNNGTVTIGTGWRNISLIETLAAEGLVVPSGVCPTPGIAGVTLGGGHSILSRPFGLTLDHLLELEMVDANGCIIRANAKCNSDLYWASRGAGGGNFGICTSFKFRTHKINTVGFAEISWGISDLKPVLTSWQEYTLPCANKRLTTTLFMSAGLEPSLLMQGVFLGSVQELQSLLQPLLEAGSPMQVTIEEIPWAEAAAKIAEKQPATPLPFKSVGPYVYELLPAEGLSIIDHFINNAPPFSTTSVFFHGLGGAVAEVPNEATAYFYRKALSNMSIFATWGQPEGAGGSIRWVEDFRLAMLPFTKGVYVNTPDLYIKNWPDAYFSCNFDRLMKVKAKYDPKNVFNFPQSIPLF